MQESFIQMPNQFGIQSPEQVIGVILYMYQFYRKFLIHIQECIKDVTFTKEHTYWLQR